MNPGETTDKEPMRNDEGTLDEWNVFGDVEWLDNDEAEDEEEQKPRRKTPAQRLAAFSLAVVVGLFLLGGVVQMLDFPQFDFNRESELIRNQPEIADWRRAVVQVTALESGTNSSRGTGFNIDPGGLIITNRHVVEDADVVTVTLEDGKTYYASRVFQSDSVDLAAVVLTSTDTTSRQRLPIVTLAKSNGLSDGDTVTIIGNPLGVRGVVIRGKVVGERRAAGAERPSTGSSSALIQLAASIHEGHSGSPVFNDEGDVVGIVFALARRAAEKNEGDSPSSEGRLGLAIPVTQIEAFLQHIRSELDVEEDASDTDVVFE